MKYYVYQYLDEYGNPYYIGKGKDKRIHAKHSVAKPPIERRVKIAVGLSEMEAYILENKLIRMYGRKIDGGILENIRLTRWTRKPGWHHTLETRNIIGIKNTGQKRTEEQKKNYRKPKTKEHALNIKKANLNRPDDGRYEKIGITMSKKRWYNNGTITKMFEPNDVPFGFTAGRKVNS